MKILLECYVAGDWNNCDYCLLNINREYAHQISRQVDKSDAFNRAMDKEVSLIEYHDYKARYLEYADANQGIIDAIATADNKISDGVWNAGHVDTATLEYNRTDTDRLLIYLQSEPVVLWRTVPKHTDVTVCTAYLPISIIKSIARGEL